MGAEVERSLGALQSHLSPIRDSLQLHSVTVVLLKSLQIHPSLSLQRQKTLACWHLYVSGGSFESTTVTVPVTDPAQLVPVGKSWLVRAHVKQRKVPWWGEGPMLSEPPRASSPCLTYSIPPSAWAWWVLVIDSACFDIPLSAGCFHSPEAPKWKPVVHVSIGVSSVPHLLYVKNNNNNSSLCVDCPGPLPF